MMTVAELKFGPTAVRLLFLFPIPYSLFSKPSDRLPCLAERTLGGRIVRRGRVLDERNHRNAWIGDALETIADAHERDRRAASFSNHLRALCRDLPRVPDVVGDQHATPLHELLVERTQQRLPARLLERRERARWMRQAASAVEQARDRVGEQRAAGRGTGDDVGLRGDLV